MLTAITGINWGDEGKGRMVDLISQEYDIVARYHGGNNAGHTVKNERGKFVLNLLPSGILRPDVVCVMGNGMVIDPHHLDGEINKLREQGISITPANLKISDRATITMPYHVDQDGLEEARLAKTGAQFGSTKRGIAYAYGDKYMKKTLRMGDLLHLDDSVKKRLVTMVDSKNLVMEGSYNAAPISVDEMWAWLEKYAAIFKDYICDVGQYLADADAAGKKVLFEAQLGALRDIDFGISLVYAHIAYPWYLFGGTAIYYTFFDLRRSPALMRAIFLWGVIIWLIPCWSFGGTISRYGLMAVPLLAPAVSLTLTRSLRRRSFIIFSSLFILLVAITLLVCHHLQSGISQ